ncbi:hypothetical protein AA0113_g12172 [Alternaria arborescens]|uniref:Uncharacterized protein n=1 Tax=Alternaria arborescens TaxID=156630 RepID=A0A4Q4PYK4_9PLEO|nr:hypothetical protein AA0111_g12240 [Alternaria arborescens]RYO13563.1 hypothetical protein AA0111_g12240 [Alternaria arborescens]RYO28403.1 hypothetical protein AA0113_g12172 [Alternaria arborescens]
MKSILFLLSFFALFATVAVGTDWKYQEGGKQHDRGYRQGDWGECGQCHRHYWACYTDCTNGKEYGNEHGNDLRYPNQECRSLCQQWAESSVHWCTKHQCKLHTGKWGEDEWHSQVRDHQKATV